VAVQTGLFVHQLADGFGATPRGSRLALAGLLYKNTDGTVRTGVLADGLGPVVTGAAGMSYNIRKHVAVTKVSETNGPTLVPNDGTVSVATTPAPGSNSRIDVIWVKQNHIQGDGGSGTTSNTPEFGVVQGASSATPSAPSVPAGALELARVTVTSGTTATSGLTFTAGQWTVATGGTLPTRDGLNDTSWIAPTMQTAWSANADNGYRFKDGHVTINLSASKASYGSGEAIFTLPEGFRPDRIYYEVGQIAGGVRFWYVSPDGTVRTTGASTGGILGSVTFPVA
jgi:hypothetical protein